jgi:hypothetical protein
MNSIRTLTTEAGSVAHDAVVEPGIAADAIAALIAVEGGLVTAIESVPVPEEFRRNPDLLNTYRSMIQQQSDTIASEMREGYDRIIAIGRRTVLLPRDARRVEAMLIARGALSTADRNTATRGGSTAASASNAPTAPASGAPTDADTVRAGVPRTGGDNGLSNDAIRTTVQGAMTSFETCHEHALDRDRTVAGDIAIRFVVDTTGHATQIQITRAEGPLRGVAQCIGEAIRGLTFTAPRASVTVDYPFHLEPAATGAH